MLGRRLVLGGVLVGALLAGGLLFGEQQPATPKGKGRLPLYWNKLGLSDEQKKKVSSIQSEYKDKIDPLRREISRLEDEEKQQLGRILTDAQRDQLRKLIATKALSEAPGEEKKPEKPKDEKKPNND